MTETRKERFLRSLTFVAVGAFVLFVLVMLAIGMWSQAKAHDFWINNGVYKGTDGTHCCGQGDCVYLWPDDVEVSSSGWFIKSLNETVPFTETQESEDGEFWRCQRSDGTRRCFFAPGQSM